MLGVDFEIYFVLCYKLQVQYKKKIYFRAFIFKQKQKKLLIIRSFFALLSNSLLNIH